MRTYPLGDKLFDKIRSKLRRIDKELPQRVLADKAMPAGSLIVLGDGREDDVVVPLVCHHLDGNKATVIVKPGSTRYGAIEKLKTYVKDFKTKTIAFVLDQEGDELPSLRKRVREKLGDNEEWHTERVASYDCLLGGDVFKLVVVVNGLDDVGGPSHKIEDHLVKLADVDRHEDSKDIWNGLDWKKRIEVFQKIQGDRDSAEEVFHQHFAGLRLLDC